MSVLAMIPARMGSQRLPKKNLALLDGVPLINRAIWICRAAGCFDQIWVNFEPFFLRTKVFKSEQVRIFLENQLRNCGISRKVGQ